MMKSEEAVVPGSPALERKDGGRKAWGRLGEDAACLYLEKKGYQILERNVRVPGAEVDILALDGSCLVIVEVRLRRSTCYGSPEESVTAAKRRRLQRAALFIASQARGRWRFNDWRIDFVGIQAEDRGEFRFNHLCGVF